MRVILGAPAGAALRGTGCGDLNWSR